ncbi:MAG: TolC family protein [Pseudomonadota bacterium]
MIHTALAILALALSLPDTTIGSCLSPEQAVALALETAPETLTAEAERDFARASLMAARSRRYPQIGLFGQTGIGDRQPIDQSRDDQVGLSASLELTSFGQRSAAIAAARETLQAAEAGELAAMVEVAQTSLIFYSNLQRSERLVGLTTRQTDGYARDAETVTSRLERQLITLADARQIESRYAAALARREQAVLMRNNSLAELAVFVGIEPNCTASEEAVLPPMVAQDLATMSRAEAMTRADLQSFNLLSARAARRAEQADLRQANRSGLPTVSLNAFALGEYDDSDLPVEDRWEREDRVGFSVRQDLFTGGQLRARQAEGRARVRAADAKVEEERRRIDFEVTRGIGALHQHAAIVRQREIASLAAAERLDLTIIELERGTKTISDYVLANEDYYNAAIEGVNASSERERTLINMAATTGLLPDAFPHLFGTGLSSEQTPQSAPHTPLSTDRKAPMPSKRNGLNGQ